jgi:hypothetical protein
VPFLHVDLLTATETLCCLYQRSALTVLILNGREGPSPKIKTHGHEKLGETEIKMAELNLSSKTGTGSAA